MIIEIKPPEYGLTNVFLAGGISGCPDWQQEVVTMLELLYTKIVIYNPRITNWTDLGDTQLYDQIKWERDHINMADIVLFWFPKETLCPITLFELGSLVFTTKPLIVGTDLNYKRRKDVEFQLLIANRKEGVESSLKGITASLIAKILKLDC